MKQWGIIMEISDSASNRKMGLYIGTLYLASSRGLMLSPCAFRDPTICPSSNMTDAPGFVPLSEFENV